MSDPKGKQINLSENLEKLNEIASWFDQQTQVDVEEGLKKVKQAAVLIKESKSRLREIENEFAEIQADISESEDTATVTTIESTQTVIVTDNSTDDNSDSGLPF